MLRIYSCTSKCPYCKYLVLILFSIQTFYFYFLLIHLFLVDIIFHIFFHYTVAVIMHISRLWDE